MRAIDYTGWGNGKLHVSCFSEKHAAWECHCECGNVIYYTSRQLQKNTPKSCGCLRNSNLTGKTFDRLKVITKTDRRDANHNIFYECVCTCGEKVFVTANGLNTKLARSCGCMQKEETHKTGVKVGNYVKENHAMDGTNIKNLTCRIPVTNTSGTKGVSYDKSRDKWVAQINFQGKHYNLGRYAKKRRSNQSETDGGRSAI